MIESNILRRVVILGYVGEPSVITSALIREVSPRSDHRGRDWSAVVTSQGSAAAPRS